MAPRGSDTPGSEAAARISVLHCPALSRSLFLIFQTAHSSSRAMARTLVIAALLMASLALVSGKAGDGSCIYDPVGDPLAVPPIVPEVTAQKI